MPEPELELALRLCLTSARDERRKQRRTCPPRHVKPWHGVPPTLGPPDNRKPSNAHRMEPRALLARRELQVRLRPLARPMVFRPVEPGGA